ncbi:MAG: DnaJ domain-containing protein [Kastovskya adunca ATA6-11-RM4]|jgi:tetratricopeptide (TPR) repeat protein|nr:DnaJ domain-containing protein [Kastovskya adunca ATA6-11-RM4]
MSESSRNYYEILEVSTDATIEEIKHAYRRLARQYHPDLNPGNRVAAERFKEIHEAYEALCHLILGSHAEQRDDLDETGDNPTKQNAHTFYVLGVEKALNRNYEGAIADYTTAIELNPGFVEAYMKRLASRYKVSDDRGVLEDCNLALQINPNLAEAHYYRGRSRYRLGYTQAAIEAYNQAIATEADYAQAHYHRGLAHHDLSDRAAATGDLKKAAALFRKQGDLAGHKLARDTLKNLNRKKSPLSKFSQKLKVPTGANSALSNALAVAKLFLFNPIEGLPHAFSHLDKQQAIAVGITYALFFNFCFVSIIYLIWQDLINNLSILSLIFVGAVPFISLGLAIAIVRGLLRHSGNSFAGDTFLAGAALLPLTLLLLLSSLVNFLPSSTMPILTIFAGCYTIFTLYSGCTQISQLSEKAAVFWVPLILLVSGFFSYFAFTSLLL